MTFEEAVAAHRSGDLEQAERGYRLFSAHPRALYNLAVLYSSSGRRDEAEGALRQVLTKSPDDALAQHSLAVHCLEDGRWDEGWRLYEARRRLGPYGDLCPPEPTGSPEWRGERLRGKHLLIVGEQGFGDQIMFGRFAKLLQGVASRITFACAPALVSLFRQAGLEAIPRPGPIPSTPDFWVFLGSIPLRLGLTPNCIPTPLTFDLTPSGRGLAVCPTGNPRQRNDANRSLHGTDAARLLTMGRDVRPEATGARDFLETARLLCGFGALVSVDTSIAHLGASLGLPTTILLTSRGCCWRYGLSGRSTPWYPDASLLRQEGDNWQSALSEVEARTAGATA